MQGFGLKELREIRKSSAAPPEGPSVKRLRYRTDAPEVVVVNRVEAETAKLFSNADRYIEIPRRTSSILLPVAG